MRKEHRILLALADEYGLVLNETGPHYKLHDSDGALVAVASKTASDWRTLRNLRAQIRRARRALPGSSKEAHEA